jgi:hypothetical protein
MATLVKCKDTNKPDVLTVEKNSKDEFAFVSINVNINKVGDEYVWDSLVLPDFALNNIHNADLNTKYGVLVAHIVKAYYDDNRTTAILSNYLLDTNNAEYKSEFDELQQIRRMAKDTAKHIIQLNIF